MRPSRGMGAMRASKMPKGKTIRRKDNPDEVTMYAKGGKAKAKTPKVPASARPPKKPVSPRLGPPFKQFKPRKWAKELA